MQKALPFFQGSPSMSPAAAELDNYIWQKMLEMKDRYSSEEIAEAASSLAMRMMLGVVWGTGAPN